MPTASMRTAGWGRSSATDAAETIDGDGPVARHVAVVEPERRGDGTRREVVVHRHRVPVDGGRVQRRVAPPVDRDQPEHLAGDAVAVQVLVGVHGDPVGGGHGAEGRAPFAERARDPLAAPRRRRARLVPWAARAANVDSQTVRKHSTWRQRPEATAMAAAMTEPPGPGKVAAAVDPGRVDPQGLFDGAWRRPRSSPRRRPRDRSTARRCRRASARRRRSPSRQASTASESGSTMSRRPNVERPMPLRTARCSKRSSLRGARGTGRTGSAHPIDRVDGCPSARRGAATRPRAARSGR